MSVFRRGQKAELFDGGESVDEATELAGKLSELHSVWSLERTGRDVAAAIWRPELGLAEVVLQRGRLLSHMGFQRGAKLYLFIEEALYLMDRANLLLFLSSGGGGGGRGGRRRGQQHLLSLQEAQDLLVGSGVPLDRYLVFCKLLRAGYIVQRHPSRWALGPGEDPKAPWAGWGGMPCGQQQQQQQGAAQQQGTQQGTQHGAAAAPAAPPAGPARKKRRVEAQQPQQRSGKWWVAAPEQAAAAAAAAEQPAAEPPAAAAAAEQPALAADQAGDDSAPAPAPAAAAAFAANPWLAGLPAGFLESLPRAQVLPTRAQRARADFPCMAPLQAIPLHDLQPPGGAAAGRSLLHFDVFQSNSQFSRKRPGQPTYIVSVLPCSAAPTPTDMVAADAAAGGVPVRFSAIEKGDICFYGATHVQLRGLMGL